MCVRVCVCVSRGKLCSLLVKKMHVHTREQNDEGAEEERKSIRLWIRTAIPKAGFILSPSLENVTPSTNAAPSLTMCEAPDRDYSEQREKQTQMGGKEARCGSAAAAEVAKGCSGPQAGV